MALELSTAGQAESASAAQQQPSAPQDERQPLTLPELEHDFALPELQAQPPLYQRWAAQCAAVIVLLGTAAVLYVVAQAVITPEGGETAPQGAFVQRVAFSSCTQRGVGPNSIWEQAVIPAAPDAWVWLGDLAYMDIPPMDCTAAANADHPDCNCKPTYLKHPSTGCLSGNVQNAQRKVEAIIRSPGYRAFVEYMCPGTAMRGEFPPPGDDRAACPRPILGVYDDHDFGWNNGNGEELENRNAIKQVFLDAIGEPRTSIRRNSLRGIQAHTQLNAGRPSEAIDVLLLDERYHRVPMPCHTRHRYCTDHTVHKGHNRKAWCKDFAGDPKHKRPAACCSKDDDIALGWCRDGKHRGDPRWPQVCDPRDANFGAQNWVIDGGGALRVANALLANETKDESGFCEVLGQVQRAWLRERIAASTAPVLIVASGSVLLGAPSRKNGPHDDPPYTSYCSGDDWDCYRPAQQNLIAELSRARGCVIVITGDYHSADIKRLHPDEAAPYATHYNSQDLAKPIYQVMASGMDTSTASGLQTGCNSTCCGYDRDEDGLRGPGKVCNIYGDPNFGVADFDWGRRRVTLSVRRKDGAGVAAGADGVPIRKVVDIDSCAEVPS